jgi:hypothetical protein
MDWRSISRALGFSQTLQHFCLGQQRFAMCFSAFALSEDLVPMLIHLIESDAPKGWTPTPSFPDYFHVQCSLYSIFLAIQTSRSDLQTFYLSMLHQDLRDFATITYATLLFPEGFCIPESVARRFFEKLLLFRRANPSLFRALRPSIIQKLKLFDPSLLWDCFGIVLLSVFPTIDIQIDQ